MDEAVVNENLNIVPHVSLFFENSLPSSETLQSTFYKVMQSSQDITDWYTINTTKYTIEENMTIVIENFENYLRYYHHDDKKYLL
uniref:ORF15 n=1 Tax=Cnaphalocrocis medinalis granulovirus TaxID=1750712 RepID=A0A0X9FKX3_9BBAC|nr:ORF15 [Cnaphalocrocis medinalis granulovirus]